MSILKTIGALSIPALLLGGAWYWWDKKSGSIELVPGAKYLITTEAIGDEGLNWADINNQLKKKVNGHKIVGGGDDRILTYVMEPESFVTMEEGEPLFQLFANDKQVQFSLVSARKI
jgi:hypothetical protein